MSTKALVPLNVLAKSSEPAGQRAGDLYFDTTTLKLRIYDGTLWNDIVGTGGAGQLQINGGTPGSFYGGTPNVDGAFAYTTVFTGSYDGGVS
jgi:hypothetical protein